jgi:hypothetical protein
VDVAVAPTTATAGGTATLTATLTNADVAGPLAGRTLEFSLNGHVVGTAVTNASGVATLPNVSVAGILPGYYPGAVTVRFAGDAGDLPGDGSGALAIVPARDVTNVVHVRKNGPVMGHRTGTNFASLTVTNPVGPHTQTLSGLFAIQLNNLPADVTLLWAKMTVNGVTYNLTITHTATGAPIINVPAEVATSLAAGHSLPKIRLLFSNPSTRHFDFDSSVFLDPT